MISRHLIKSSIIYTVIGALPLLSAFLLLIFYTNYISKADYGAFVIYISFTLLVQVLVNFGLDTYIGISYFEFKHDPARLRNHIGSIAAYLLVIGFVSTGFFLIAGKLLFGLVFQGKDIFFFPYGLMSVITAIFNSFFKTYSNLLINQQRPVRFAVINFANFFMTIGFSLAGLFMYPHTLTGPMWGRLLSGAGIFLIALVSFQSEFKIRLVLGETLKKVVRFSLPVLIFFLLSWLISNIYPYLINYFMSLGDIAVFGLALQFTLLIEFMLNGLSNAFMPRVYGLMKTENLTHSTPELNKYFSTYNALSLIIIPSATFILPVFLPFFINKNFEDCYVFLAILNISFASRGLYNYFLAPIYFLQKTRVLPKIYSYTAIIQLITSVVLIKFFGIWGAVWAHLLTKIIQNIFLFTESRKFFRYSFNVNKMIILPALVSLVIIASEYFTTPKNIHWIHLFQMLSTFALVWMFYSREIIPMAKSVKNWMKLQE